MLQIPVPAHEIKCVNKKNEEIISDWFTTDINNSFNKQKKYIAK